MAQKRSSPKTKKSRPKSALPGRNPFKALFEGAVDPMIIIDADRRLVDANRAACELFGLTRKEILRQRIEDLARTDVERPFEQLWPEWLKLGKRKQEFQISRPNAKERDVECTLTPNFLPGFHAAVLRDVTEKKQAEVTLRRMSGVFREAGDPIIIEDLEGRIIDASYGAEQAYGWTREELIGQPTKTIIPPERHELTDELLARCGGGETVSNVEAVQQNKAGHQFPVLCTLSPITDEGGELVAIARIAKDITEVKLAQAQLGRMSKVFKEAADPIVVEDLDGHVIDLNAEAERAYGWEREALLGRSGETIVPPEQRQQTEELLARSRGGEVVRNAQGVRWNQAGERFPVLFTLSPITDEQGNLVAIARIAKDITELKREEAGSKRLSQVFTESADPLVISDPAGNILDLNAEAERAYGWNREELLGKPINTIVPPERHQNTSQLLARCKSGEAIRNVEGLRWNRTGDRFPVLVTLSPLTDEEGNLTAVLTLVKDITELKRAEAQRRRVEGKIQQAQKLESLGVLAGGIAHDFNNLLMAVLGHADLTLSELPPESPARPNVERIVTASQRAAELTGQMLAYSGKGKFVVQALDLSKLVQEMGYLLETVISRKATLEYRLNKNLPRVEADGGQIRQVVMNLIMNASDALETAGGVITIRTGVLKADRAYLARTQLNEDLPEGSYVYVEVTDSGSGMGKKTIAKMFDPFFTTKFTGRGLGLAAVLGIVRGHRGTIEVLSRPSHGTTVKVLLPASDADAPVREEAPPEAEDWQGSGTILIIDDDEAVLAVTKTMLTKRGFRVLVADDGSQGLEFFRKHADQVVLVILDLTMPGISARETFRELRRLKQDVKVIVSSGYTEEDVTGQFTGEPLAGILQKPYRSSTLLEKIRQILEQ